MGVHIKACKELNKPHYIALTNVDGCINHLYPCSELRETTVFCSENQWTEFTEPNIYAYIYMMHTFKQGT